VQNVLLKDSQGITVNIADLNENNTIDELDQGVSIATKENGRLFILPDEDYSIEFSKASSVARITVQYFDVNDEQYILYEFDDMEAEQELIKKISF